MLYQPHQEGGAVGLWTHALRKEHLNFPTASGLNGLSHPYGRLLPAQKVRYKADEANDEQKRSSACV
jgi:hypothetical protein